MDSGYGNEGSRNVGLQLTMGKSTAISAPARQTVLDCFARSCSLSGWGMLACAAMVDMTLYEQGNEINDKLHKCGMKCIFGK